ncbi:hypothetical protein M427DRAFT_52929 [Gonapodya prolifera JEL478]|uniref:Uncharacterized protein n=1 Tax=Gonapodya prolifera (strain JEL478) TaxID=1344416 RepID=A0A139ARW9_GONPJ|nr:hypothetical protein M427DRAFT_52929 [Gonapodya prolifera JEL478]|eukprot:KXS19501.1 hypothetical protein M427DRAFT_52929 [Gonapodya prolifera JEL478]
MTARENTPSIPIYNWLFELDVGEGSPVPNACSKDFKVGKHIFALILQGDPRGLFLVPRTITQDDVYLKYRIHVLLSPKEEPLFTFELERLFLKDRPKAWGWNLGRDWATLENKLQCPENRLHLGVQIYDHPELRELVVGRGTQRILNLPVIPPGINSFATIHNKGGMPYSRWRRPSSSKARWYLQATQKEKFESSRATDFLIVSADVRGNLATEIGPEGL